MSQFQSPQFDASVVPEKFKDASGNVNVQALTASAGHMGINAQDFMTATGQLDVTRLSLAYREKEAAVVKPQPQPQPQPVPVTVPVINTDAPENTGEVDWSSVRLGEDGKIPAAQRQMLLNAKVPMAVINNFEAGQKAILENNMYRLTSALPGGQETYNKLVEWANAGGLDIPERQRMAEALRGPAGDMALMGYFQRYVAANPGVMSASEASGEPDLLGVNTAGGPAAAGPSAEAQPFMTAAERHAAFADPRWRRGDKDYVEHVQARAIATTAQVVEMQKANPSKNWSAPTGFNK